MNEMEWFRYEDMSTTNGVKVQLNSFIVTKHTSKGVWIKIGYNRYNNSNTRFVLRGAKKRYACPTVEEAKESFIKRKSRQLKIYETRVNHAKMAMLAVNKEELFCSHWSFSPSNVITNAP